jgi:D-alanyl-D-alanine carboxypeptidase
MPGARSAGPLGGEVVLGPNSVAGPARPPFALQTIHTELGIAADYAITRGLAFHAEAKELVVAAIAPDDGSEVRLTPLAAEAWRRMEAAARHDGIVLWPLSGFRSVERQAAIIRKKRQQGQAIHDILRLVAAPGYSEHHSGRALDIGAPDEPLLEAGFGDTAAFRWLERRARDFGFRLSYPKGNERGILYEPWHWFYAP